MHWVRNKKINIAPVEWRSTDRLLHFWGDLDLDQHPAAVQVNRALSVLKVWSTPHLWSAFASQNEMPWGKKRAVFVALSGCQGAAWTSCWTSYIGDTKITSFWKHASRKHDLNCQSRACCICESSKKDCKNGVTKGLSFTKSHRRKPPFSPACRLWKRQVLLHGAPCPAIGDQAPGAASVRPAGQAPGPSLSSPGSAQPTGARNNRGKKWGSASTARTMCTGKEGGDKYLYLVTSQGAC